MTREEEIKCASKDYVNYLLDKQEYHNEDYTEYDIKQAFEKGAELADKHPNLSSLWHDASEEPKNETHILIEYDYLGSKEFQSFNIGDGLVNWERLKKYYRISRWAYISDLLPKCSE